MTKCLIYLPDDLDIVELTHLIPAAIQLDNKSILNIYLESINEQEFVSYFLDHIYCYLEHCKDNIVKVAFSYINKDALTLSLCLLYDTIATHLIGCLGKCRDIHFIDYTNLTNRVIVEV